MGNLISNVGRFKIIESTLREGEQFANAYFTRGLCRAMLELRALLTCPQKRRLKCTVYQAISKPADQSSAKALDSFGVEYIELTSPAASEASRQDCIEICKLGLKAKILTRACYFPVNSLFLTFI